jgi:NTE family protein
LAGTIEGHDPTMAMDLVLEGGGVKGIGLAGGVLALSDAGYSFERLAGTSAGAITAALIAALQAAHEPLSRLEDIMYAVEYEKFKEDGWLRKRFGAAGDAERLALHMGLYSGDYLVTWLGGLLEDIGITTFDQLRQNDDKSSLPPDHQYSLVVFTSDITRGRAVQLPWDYEAYGCDPGSQKIVDAVRASMSIPFFFDPVHLKAPAATFDGVDYGAGAVTWVDGGMLSNFPIDVFDRTDNQPARWPTVGIKLSAQRTEMPPGRPCDSVVLEALDCLHTLLNNTDRY